jgi:acetolactate synthase-1/2/3 large subunit
MTGTRVNGGEAVLEVLRAAGVDHAFGVPGESFMGVLDAMYGESGIRFVSTRHEEGAAFMATAYARLTGRPALALATRMVGGGHASIAIHTARQDSTPLIVILGQVPTAFRHREAFQEVELTTVFREIAKWAVEPPAADRLTELTIRAARLAVSGRPGPVVLSLREDLLGAEVPRPDVRPIVAPVPAPHPDAVRQIHQLIRGASRPAFLVGAGILAARATDALVRVAEQEEVPVFTGWRRPDAFPNDHPLYLGWAGLRSPTEPFRRLKSADLIVAIGTRLGEFPTHRFKIPADGTRLAHVDVAAESLGGHLQPDVACVSDARLFLEALAELGAADRADEDRLTERRRQNQQDRADWEAATTPGRGKARDGFVDQQVVAAAIQPVLDRGGILATDAGNFAGWPARYLRWHEPGTFLGPSSGAMGYGIPSAIGAKLARPDRPVVCIAGDGGFLMTGMELETAVRENVPFALVVIDNEQYGTIRMHQEKDHPGRPIGTRLGPVDFAALAESLGARGMTITDNADVGEAIDDAARSDRPTVVHMRVDPDQLFVGDDAAPAGAMAAAGATAAGRGG